MFVSGLVLLFTYTMIHTKHGDNDIPNDFQIDNQCDDSRVLTYVYMIYITRIDSTHLHTEKYFRNLIESTQNQIIFTIF